MNDLRVPCKTCGVDMRAPDKFCSNCGQKNAYSAGEIIDALFSSPKSEHKDLSEKLEGNPNKQLHEATPQTPETSNPLQILSFETSKNQNGDKEKTKQKPSTPQELKLEVKKHNRFMILYSIGVIAVGSGFMFVAYWLVVSQVTADLAGCAILILGCIGLLMIFVGTSIPFSGKCPKCGALRGVELDEAKSDRLADTRSGYETVTRQVKNSDGKVVQEYQEQVRVQKKAYIVHYKCVVCKHESTKTRQTSSHDFDN